MCKAVCGISTAMEVLVRLLHGEVPPILHDCCDVSPRTAVHLYKVIILTRNKVRSIIATTDAILIACLLCTRRFLAFINVFVFFFLAEQSNVELMSIEPNGFGS